MPYFDEADLKREFPANYLARGRTYYAAGRVGALEVRDEIGRAHV